MSKTSRKHSLKFIENLKGEREENNNNSYVASNNLITCFEMDSLLHIETKKQKLRQTDKYFNFHSVSLLSKAPLLRRSSALSPC